MKEPRRTIKNLDQGIAPIIRAKKRKSYKFLGRTQKKTNENTVKDLMSTFPAELLSFLRDTKRCVGKIVINSSESNEIQKYDEIEIEYTNKTKSEMEKEAKDLKDNICKSKLHNRFSDKKYATFRKDTGLNMPSLYYVRKERSNLSKSLFRIYRNAFGHYVDCEKKIRKVITERFKLLKVKNNEIRVKLCADGTNAGRTKLLNFCFTLPDEGRVAQTSVGIFALGVFKIKKENYITLKYCLSECAKNLNKFSKENEIIIDGKSYKIKFLLSGDMKFLHIAMGLNGCNSKNSCLCCKIENSNYYKNDKNDIKNNKRTNEEMNEKIKFLEPDKSDQGYQRKPIFEFISFEDVVFDTLHLLLRITGKLLSLVLRQCIILDDNKSLNIDELIYQKKFYTHLANIGIKDPYTLEKTETETGQNMSIRMRSFNGQDCLIALKNINLIDEFPEIVNNDEINSVFTDFYEIFVKLKENFYIDNTGLLETETDDWLKSFINCFPTKHVTPYMHLFASHLCFFVEKHGDVDVLNQQGLENYNNQTTSQFFGQTNRSVDFTYQLTEYRNILEHLRSSDEPKEILKRATSSKRDLRKGIIEKESHENWCQFKFKDYILTSDQIKGFGNSNVSCNVIEAAMSILVPDDIYLLNTSSCRKFLDGNFVDLSNTCFKLFKGLSGLVCLNEKQILLIFIRFDSKKIYFVDPTKCNDKIESVFLKNWKNFSKNRLDLNNEQGWKIEKFKLNKLNNSNLNAKIDILIVMCFDLIIKSKVTLSNPKEKALVNFKQAILQTFKENSDLTSFCSFCSLSTDPSNCYECQCTRIFHKGCMDPNYDDLYQYESFLCFFCRQEKNLDLF